MKTMISVSAMICWGTFFAHTFFADIGAVSSRNWLGGIGCFAGIAAVVFTAYIIPPFLFPKKSHPSSTRQSSEEREFWISIIFFAIWSFGFDYTEVFLLPRDWAKVWPLLNICGLYVIWRFWPERKYCPETGADSEK
jgi:hypothetical protein